MNPDLNLKFQTKYFQIHLRASYFCNQIENWITNDREPFPKVGSKGLIFEKFSWKNELSQFWSGSFLDTSWMSRESRNMILNAWKLLENFKKIIKMIKSKIDKENEQLWRKQPRKQCTSDFRFFLSFSFLFKMVRSTLLQLPTSGRPKAEIWPLNAD